MLSSIEPGRVRRIGEHDLRRRLDRAIGRAIVDPRYAASLLANPTLALDGGGCSPQQHLELRQISASSIRDFARQAAMLFWPTSGSNVPVVEARGIVAERALR
jgi:hypothetical protein